MRGVMHFFLTQFNMEFIFYCQFDIILIQLNVVTFKRE